MSSRREAAFSAARAFGSKYGPDFCALIPTAYDNSVRGGRSWKAQPNSQRQSARKYPAAA
jgi:hypothetical protein